MDQVINFNKTFSRRIAEYKTIFTNFLIYENGTLKENWSTYLKPLIKSSGWLALWKISRNICHHFNIPFPSMVLVNVIDIKFENLEAIVKILAVQSEISLPETHVVPLIELWPTNEQNCGENLILTANSLEMLRFFYTKLFMPWDVDDENVYKWLNQRLESRLRLFYDIKEGIISKQQASFINDFVNDAKHLIQEREILENKMNSDLANDEIEEDLLNLNINIELIKTEFKLIEDPSTRLVILNKDEHENKICNWLICHESKIENYITFINAANNYISNAELQFASDLSFALESCKTNDTIILSASHHYITKNVRELYNGITMKGISKRDDTIISTENEKTMLDLYDKTCIENLTLKIENCQCAIIIRHVKVTLTNCLLKGKMNDGILLLPGSELELINCTLMNFSTAIIGNSNCVIKLHNCKICNVENGIQTEDNCSLILENTLFENCSEYALYVEMDHSSTIVQTGNFDLLKIIPSFVCNNVKGTNNIKGDVIIDQKPKLEYFND